MTILPGLPAGPRVKAAAETVSFVAGHRSARTGRLYLIEERPQPGAPKEGPHARIVVMAWRITTDAQGRPVGAECPSDWPGVVAKVVPPLEWARLRRDVYERLIAQIEGA